MPDSSLCPVPDTQSTQGHWVCILGTHTHGIETEISERVKKKNNEIMGQTGDQEQTSEAGLFNTLFC